MGYSMKMGSKEQYSPTAFKTKDLVMLMHEPGHKEKLISIKSDKKVVKNPPKEGYHTTGNTTTYTYTSTYASNTKKPKSEKRKRFDIAFGEASKKGLKTFPFEGGIYTTEKTPGSNTPKTRKEITSITATGVGIKKYTPKIEASLIGPKDIKTPPSGKIIPPKTIPPKKKRRKKKFRNTKVGKFINSRDWFPFDNLGDYINFPKSKPKCGCK